MEREQPKGNREEIYKRALRYRALLRIREEILRSVPHDEIRDALKNLGSELPEEKRLK